MSDRWPLWPGLLCLLIPLVAPADAWALGRAGFGSGLPYGTPLLGVGFELDLGPHLAALGGLGVGNYRSPWAAGLRLSLARPEKRWRPHLTAMHWTEGNTSSRASG